MDCQQDNTAPLHDPVQFLCPHALSVTVQMGEHGNGINEIKTLVAVAKRRHLTVNFKSPARYVFAAPLDSFCVHVGPMPLDSREGFAEPYQGPPATTAKIEHRLEKFKGIARLADSILDFLRGLFSHCSENA